MMFASLVSALVLAGATASAADVNVGPIPNSLNISASANDNVTTQGYDPSKEYYAYSTIQVWVGSLGVYVGTMIGADLANSAKNVIQTKCPTDFGVLSECHVNKGGPRAAIGGRCKDKKRNVVDCKTEIETINFVWSSPEARRILIETATSTLEAMSDRHSDNNRWTVDGTRACHVADTVRVNLPPFHGQGTQSNYFHITLGNSVGYDEYLWWTCCDRKARHLEEIDLHVDMLSDQILQQWPQWSGKGFKRDTRCIINGWEACWGEGTGTGTGNSTGSGNATGSGSHSGL